MIKDEFKYLQVSDTPSPWWKELIVLIVTLAIIFGVLWIVSHYLSLRNFKYAVENCEIKCDGGGKVIVDSWQDYLERARKEEWPSLAETAEEEAVQAYKDCMEGCIESEMNPYLPPILH